MTRAEIQKTLQAVFRDVFDDETIALRDDMTAKDVKLWDSLNHINLIIAAERKFKVRFAAREVTGLKNVGEFLSLLQSKLP